MPGPSAPVLTNKAVGSIEGSIPSASAKPMTPGTEHCGEIPALRQQLEAASISQLAMPQTMAPAAAATLEIAPSAIPLPAQKPVPPTVEMAVAVAELDEEQAPIVAEDEPSIQSPHLPDPVPAGLTALSANMRTFDDEADSRKPASDSIAPLPMNGQTVLDLLEQGEPRQLLSNGAFELREGVLHPLTLPEFSSTGFLADAPLPQGEDRWSPLAEPAHPASSLGVPELEFDPNLLQILDAHEERDRELKAIESVGLASMCEHKWNPAAWPIAPGAVSFDFSNLAWTSTRAVIVPAFESAVAVDQALLDNVSAFEQQRQQNEALEAAAGGLAPLVASNEIPGIEARDGQFKPEVPAVRGFLPWPQAAPFGRPVACFELEFDAEVLNRVHEWEESQGEEPAPVEAPAEASQTDPGEITARFEIPVAVEPPAPVAAEPPAPIEAAPVEQALVTLSQALVVDSAHAESSSYEVEALTPIIESPVPPIAKLTKLPSFELTPAGQKPGPKQRPPQSEFSGCDPLVPSIGKLIRIIPSPIMNIQHSKVTAPPGWLVTAAIALLIPITALGVVNYWILPAQRANATPAAAAAAASVTPVEAASKPAVADPKPAAASPTTAGPGLAMWQKQLELAGLRLQNSTVKCLIVNHSKADAPAMNLLVTLRSARGNEPPVGTFRVRLSPLASGNSREIAEPISFTPPMRPNVDWSDLRADIQVSKP